MPMITVGQWPPVTPAWAVSATLYLHFLERGDESEADRAVAVGLLCSGPSELGIEAYAPYLSAQSII